MAKYRRCTNNTRPSAKQATSAPSRLITQLRLPISGAAANEATELSSMLRLYPDEGRRTYRLLATAAASIRPQRPSMSLQSFVLTQKQRGWPRDGTVETADYMGFGGARVLLALLGWRSRCPLSSPRPPGTHPTQPRSARAPSSRPGYARPPSRTCLCTGDLVALHWLILGSSRPSGTWMEVEATATTIFNFFAAHFCNLTSVYLGEPLMVQWRGQKIRNWHATGCRGQIRPNPPGCDQMGPRWTCLTTYFGGQRLVGVTTVFCEEGD